MAPFQCARPRPVDRTLATSSTMRVKQAGRDCLSGNLPQELQTAIDWCGTLRIVVMH